MSGFWKDCLQRRDKGLQTLRSGVDIEAFIALFFVEDGSMPPPSLGHLARNCVLVYQVANPAHRDRTASVKVTKESATEWREGFYEGIPVLVRDLSHRPTLSGCCSDNEVKVVTPGYLTPCEILGARPGQFGVLDWEILEVNSINPSSQSVVEAQWRVQISPLMSGPRGSKC